ncbi:MAG: cytochrome c-type biogenesis protein CcmE [Gammaproteobacteria bacterium]|jgi:cytochrome c-type biogenesis protein CcmE
MADHETPEPNPTNPTDGSDMDLSPRTNVDGTAVGVKRKRNVVPLVVLAMVFVAGGVIVTQFLTSAVDYYCNVDEVGVREGCDGDRRIRLQGTVDQGSVDISNGVTGFTISFNGEKLPVRYQGEPGGIFRECLPVVVHGVIDDGALVGDRVEVRHSDEYVSVNDDRVADAQDLGCAPPSV